ncbi:hypothetical protein POJ06DRAFT_196736 [Lipomyces tetrasporus]|uniref:1-phosphatidylinositol-4-phosphate 5-kinase n=1 Tax=Lipomyces tetrasporus TaxID=54092 RepID=A0AAD7QS18_9ASCO|nr:uncharacterized protein POJ06DRAFT_196736 [Lipomyces tetrasporus]KAJ8100474.1 hypothetical protein POJ06DRAFT_196736 [Lipomyces tetrasporus]
MPPSLDSTGSSVTQMFTSRSHSGPLVLKPAAAMASATTVTEPVVTNTALTGTEANGTAPTADTAGKTTAVPSTSEASAKATTTDVDQAESHEVNFEDFHDALVSLTSNEIELRLDQKDYFDPKFMPPSSLLQNGSTSGRVNGSHMGDVAHVMVENEADRAVQDRGTNMLANGTGTGHSTNNTSTSVLISRSPSLTTNSSRSTSSPRPKTTSGLTLNTFISPASISSGASASSATPHRPSPLSYSSSSADINDDADVTLVHGINTSPSSTIRSSRPPNAFQSISSPDVASLPPRSPSLSPESASTAVNKRSGILVPVTSPKLTARALSGSQPTITQSPTATSGPGKLTGTNLTIMSSHATSLTTTTTTTTTTETVATDEDEERDSFAAESPILVGASGSSQAAASTATGIRGPMSIARQRTFPAGGSEVEDHHNEPSEEVRRMRDEIIAKRETKKRRKEFLEDDKVLVGTKVGEDHVNYILAYNMLTGIRVAVSRTTAKLDRELTENDFISKHKLAFDISGNELTPSAKYDFKFKDYAPWVFRHLRQLFRLDPADYLISLTSKYIVSELGSPGKSGSFFYFSRDYRFIIKTIHHSEHKFLLRILKEYYNHVKANPNTLISQFYGLHRVKLPYGRKIHFIIMNNLFPPHRDIHQTFDLKGSTIGRDYDERKLKNNKHATMKDLNWMRRNKHISLGPRKRTQFMTQLETDVKLLERLNIMDYSLLIGIHDLRKGNTENIRDSTLTMFTPDQQMLERTPSRLERDRRMSLRRAFSTANPASLEQVIDVLRSDEYPGRKRFTFYADDGGFRATDEHDGPLNEIYYLGVIDCLTNYSFVKKVETFWKGLSHSREKLSAIPPVEYGERFYKFIISIVKAAGQSGADDERYQISSLAPGGSANETMAEIVEIREAA